ncbi:AraC family transcriptional regulator [Pseudomonas sp. N040]|uniref:AraC family transcriptional regulator n=1 Tax=Pseudomonas sp. N040 TaxID=2785325 RepID=UPI0018A2998B|nr:AraC family transcriptional regulator [Pseudomonas sp. N040]MBF7729406.1 AraC family transcriptional regulator [Pseudomonas sp. N040]MBW7013046.1 AraC family transcriptional regulator [Pseudomonas sp. N040]
MASHSILSLRHIANRLKELGSDPAPVLARHGLDLDRIALDSRIDYALELRIFCSLCELVSEPLAGLKVGSKIGFTGYGPLSLLLLTCATPWEAMQASLRYQPLTYLFSQPGFVPGPRSSELTFKPLELPDWPFRLRIDMELAGAFKLLQDLQQTASIDLALELVSLPYPRPAESRAYEEFFGCPVMFGDSHARLRILNSKLQQPMANADSMVNAMYRQECEKLREIALRDTADNIAGEVRQHLLLFDHAYPDAPAVAAVFGMSERSLRSRLRAEGLSFRRLLDQVRYERARQRLRDTRDSIELIALQLGYAETASFIHAFQRWSGTTPSAYRRSSQNPGS